MLFYLGAWVLQSCPSLTMKRAWTIMDPCAITVLEVIAVARKLELRNIACSLNLTNGVKD